MFYRMHFILLLSLCSSAAQNGAGLSAANVFPDDSVKVQPVNDPDAGVTIHAAKVYSDPGRKLTQMRFSLAVQDEWVSKVFAVVTIVSPTGEVRSGEMWPLSIASKAGVKDCREFLRGEVTPGDHVVINVGRVIKHGVAYKLPAISRDEFASLPGVPIQDRPGNDALVTPNIVCDYSYCDNCNNLAVTNCKKGIQSYSCSINPSCSCSYTCVQ